MGNLASLIATEEAFERPDVTEHEPKHKSARREREADNCENTTEAADFDKNEVHEPLELGRVQDPCELDRVKDSDVQRMSGDDDKITSRDLEQSHGSNLMEAECEIECTICMETISGGTVLPCQCKLDYCLTCWDKALASSFTQRGQATCPSCRTLVRVDFDVEKQCLVFSKETVDMTHAAAKELVQKAHAEWERQRPGAPQAEFAQYLESHTDFSNYVNYRQGAISRLRHQAMPVQVNILKQYGKDNPSLRDAHSDARELLAKCSIADMKAFMKGTCVDAAGCLEKSDLIGRLTEKATPARIVSVWASRKCSAPKCVCGNSFRRLTGVERFKMLQDGFESRSDADVEAMVRANQEAKLVVCDICEKDVPLYQSFVWMCENRNDSILHATSYDICENCFTDCACLQ